jgi:hypothetical protein
MPTSMATRSGQAQPSRRFGDRSGFANCNKNRDAVELHRSVFPEGRTTIGSLNDVVRV